MGAPGGARLTAASAAQLARARGRRPAPADRDCADRLGRRLLPKATKIHSGAASARTAWRPHPRGPASWERGVALALGWPSCGTGQGRSAGRRPAHVVGGDELTAARRKPPPAGRPLASVPHGRAPGERAPHFVPREACVPLLAGPRKEASYPGAGAGSAVGPRCSDSWEEAWPDPHPTLSEPRRPRNPEPGARSPCPRSQTENDQHVSERAGGDKGCHGVTVTAEERGGVELLYAGQRLLRPGEQ